jgi:hypothetical protein
MRPGSLIRFGVGILLSLEIIRLWLSGNALSVAAAFLAVLLLILSVAFFVFRF